MLGRLLLAVLAPVDTRAWSYQDYWSTEFSGSGSNPKIICHVDACEALWSMGLGEDQLVGYFGHSGPTMFSHGDMCHGNLCMQAHFERMTSVDGDAAYSIDMAKVNALNADIMVDYAYRMPSTAPTSPADNTYNGLLGYAPQWDDIESHDTMQVVFLLVAGVSYTFVIEEVQRFADAVSPTSSRTNLDIHGHCESMTEAMTDMVQTASTMWASGIRVLAASFTTEMIYAAQPTDDPVLLMLEQIGVPIYHVDVNDARGAYWEYIQFPSIAMNGTRDTATGATRPSGDPMYNVDVWLYDSRDTTYHTEDIVITDVAWQAGQVNHWPIDMAFTYQRAARILSTLRGTFQAASRLTPQTNCKLNPTHDMLQAGEWSCHDPDPHYPTCPESNIVADLGSSATSAEAEGDRFDIGVLVGVSMGTFAVGGCVGGFIAWTFLRRTGGNGIDGVPPTTLGNSC